MKLIDITQELFSCRIDPRDFPPVQEQVKNIPEHKHNLTKITMSVHNGTHIDAPKHFLDDGKAVHELDLGIFYGDCSVVGFDGVVGENEIAPVLKTCRERLLLKGACELSDGGAAAIANSRVRLVGVESQSVGNALRPMSVHLILLHKGIIPLEDLNLSRVAPGEYILSAFPLNLEGSDGAPVRAVLMTPDGQS